ncbi:MAG: AAA family ATPase [Actinomycetota bacterium]
MSGKSILFCGSKGGCGCSFITYSVASYLALKKDKNILLVDLGFGSYGSRAVFDLMEKEVKDLGDIGKKSRDIDITLLRNLVINTESTLNLILPPLGRGSDFLSELDLGNFLDKVGCHFDLVLVDLPFLAFHDLSAELLREVERMVIVSCPSLVSVSNLNLILSRINSKQISLDADLVINKYNLRPSMSPSIINSYVNHPIRAFIPYDRDIDFLFLNKGPASIFKYNLRITSSIASLSNSLYGEMGYV